MQLFLSLLRTPSATIARIPTWKFVGVLLDRWLLFLIVISIGITGFSQSLDVPQTALGPAGSLLSNGSTLRSSGVAPGFGAPQFGGSQQFGGVQNFGGPTAASPGFFGGNSAPRIRLGNQGGPLFDPYANGAGNATLGPGNLFPSQSGAAVSAPTGGIFGGGGIFSSQAPPIFGSAAANGSAAAGPSIFGGSPVLVPSTGITPNGFGTAVYPQSAVPSGSPSTLFPGGLFNGGLFRGRVGGGGGFFNANSANTAFRVLQGARLRHTFINAGNGQQDLAINTTDVSVAFAVPNFLSLQRPLFIAPSFSLNLFDGPRGSSGSDLPSSTYGAFLDFGWQSDPNQMIGAEFGVRVGAFSDFDTFNNDTIRVLGKGLASFRLTPFTTFKIGAFYLDRNRVKILPAGGFLYQPNATSRFDIFFPQPKIARYLRTVGTKDVWWFVNGEYGGGSWTIERDDGTEDSIDVNDLRLTLGLEWGQTDLIRVGRRSGFAEIGFAFDREVVYRRQPGDNFDTDDGFLFRVGFGY